MAWTMPIAPKEKENPAIGSWFYQCVLRVRDAAKKFWKHKKSVTDTVTRGGLNKIMENAYVLWICKQLQFGTKRVDKGQISTVKR